MATLFPSGYAGAWRTWDQLMGMKTVWNLHPEVRRRLLALMEAATAAGHPLGVGTGWRKQPTNPDGSCKSGFACPGNSYHEGFTSNGARPNGSNDMNALAIDTVPTSSWPWMNANCHRYGFIHFANVNSEPWHIQPFEVPRSRNYATSSPRIIAFNLPDDPEVDLPMTPADVALVNKLIDDKIPAFAAATAAKVWAEIISGPPGGLGPANAEQTLFEIRTMARGVNPAAQAVTTELRAQAGENFDALLAAIKAVPGGGGGGGVGAISDEDLAKIAQVVNDEAHRRSES